MDAWQMPTMQGFHNHTSIVGPLANPALATGENQASLIYP